MVMATLKEYCDCTPPGVGDRKCGHNDTCTILRQFYNGRYLIQDKVGYVRAVDQDKIVIEELGW